MLNERNKMRVFAHSAIDVYEDDVYSDLQALKDGNLEKTRADARLNNTAIRQATLMATALAEFIVDNVTDRTITSHTDPEVLAGDIFNIIKKMIPTRLGQLQNDVGYNNVQIFSGTEEPSPDLGKPGDLYVRFEK